MSFLRLGTPGIIGKIRGDTQCVTLRKHRSGSANCMPKLTRKDAFVSHGFGEYCADGLLGFALKISKDEYKDCQAVVESNTLN